MEMMDSISEADLTILYGSQTGNAEFLAYNISEDAKKTGLTVELSTLNDALEAGNLAWQRLLVVTSTHDNGHMPENADAFWLWLTSSDSPQYEGLPYAVLTIGDSMYEDFCKAGRDLDTALAEHGGAPMLDRKECDVDFDMTAKPWVKEFLTAVSGVAPWNPSSSTSIDAESAQEFVSEAEQWHAAGVVALRALCLPGSSKSAFHVELELPEQFQYLPGDSLDTRPLNNQILVEEWVQAFPGVATVRIGDAVLPVRDALRSRLELRMPHIGFVDALLDRCVASAMTDRIRALLASGDRQALEAWLWGRDVLDIIHEFGFAGSNLQAIIDVMRPLQVRSYSIASSPRAHGTRLGLTISSVMYEANGRSHFGTGSSHLESLIGSEVLVRRVVAPSFKLPERDDTPIIMIGPGVGVAPFIGFLEDRKARGAAGDAWLFFGEKNRETDWLYEPEMTSWLKSGVLTKLSLAFSRDQEEKHYVQHEILAQAAEVREWVDQGAHIYICGDKNHMAHDVEEALIQVLGEGAGAYTEKVGIRALDALREAGRYSKDVY